MTAKSTFLPSISAICLAVANDHRMSPYFPLKVQRNWLISSSFSHRFFRLLTIKAMTLATTTVQNKAASISHTLVSVMH
jgi:hypothetical protein